MFDKYNNLANRHVEFIWLIYLEKRKLQYDLSHEEDVNFGSRKSLKMNSYLVILNRINAELEKIKKVLWRHKAKIIIFI